MTLVSLGTWENRMSRTSMVASAYEHMATHLIKAKENHKFEWENETENIGRRRRKGCDENGACNNIDLFVLCIYICTFRHRHTAHTHTRARAENWTLFFVAVLCIIIITIVVPMGRYIARPSLCLHGFRCTDFMWTYDYYYWYTVYCLYRCITLSNAIHSFC